MSETSAAIKRSKGRPRLYPATMRGLSEIKLELKVGGLSSIDDFPAIEDIAMPGDGKSFNIESRRNSDMNVKGPDQ